ncbi:CBS domain-containing protein [Planctomicrobium piriforme]|uniref:CBS domain-containing protein n=1 Tax=Planctomicrobium piriforme TaxID=1576369 RepID=A0A1I3C4E0_9PLAN|nr:CBS domain-containing protein [Planctomicrobium piriforme]SFH69414.1 CBS domain-containing protein [Planctomicrobium piriforme]
MFLTVREVALRAPVTVLPDLAISEAEQLLISQNASEIYVTDATERLLGVVPDYEILKYRLIGGDGKARISALMSAITVTLEPSASIEAGARLLREHVHASIPVVEQGRLIGQLCRINLLRILAESGGATSGDLLPMQPPSVAAPKFMKPAQLAWGMAAASR